MDPIHNNQSWGKDRKRQPNQCPQKWNSFGLSSWWINFGYRSLKSSKAQVHTRKGPVVLTLSLLGFSGLQSHGRDSPGVLYRVVVMAVIEVWISPKRFYVLRLRKISVDHCPTKVNLWPILGPRHRLIMSTILNRGGIDLGHKNLLLLGL